MQTAWKRRGRCDTVGMSREERHAEIGEAASMEMEMEMEMASSNELTSSQRCQCPGCFFPTLQDTGQPTSSS
jgi:hypothetical protein